MQVKLISITPRAEKIIEEAGRTAYLSCNKVKKNSEVGFIKMLIRRDHLSIFEHASATFRIKGGSRAFTHQVVRHRLCSFTQQSQRYVDEANFDYVEPRMIKKNKKAHELFMNSIQKAKEAYRNLQKLGIINEDARFVLPNAITSEIVITANLREWRHIVELRGGPDAQWEIRGIVIEILKILKKETPSVFSDFKIMKKSRVVKKIKFKLSAGA